MVRELSLAVVGIPYANTDGSNRRFEILLCRPGEPVQLVPEPKNPHDSSAVAVMSARGVQIGYLSAERCGWITKIIASGEEIRAVFQKGGKHVAIIRAAIGGGEPTLPPEIDAPDTASQAASEDDWYPDYIPPDDFD